MPEAPKPEILESKVGPEAESDASAGGGLDLAGGFWMAMLVWLIVLFIPGAALFGVIFVPVMFWLMFLKRPYAVWLLLFSPFFLVPVFCWNMGVYGYVTGTGKMLCNGLMAGTHIDKHTRAEWVTLGCEIFGYEPMITGPNNAAISAMTTIFGPMRGAYVGPYPNASEAQKALESAMEVSPYFSLAHKSVVVEMYGVDFYLYPYVARHYLGTRDDSRRARKTRAALVENRCLILEVLSGGESAESAQEKDIYLFDARNGDMLCHYYKDWDGNYSSNPIVAWISWW